MSSTREEWCLAIALVTAVCLVPRPGAAANKKASHATSEVLRFNSHRSATLYIDARDALAQDDSDRALGYLNEAMQSEDSAPALAELHFLRAGARVRRAQALGILPAPGNESMSTDYAAIALSYEAAAEDVRTYLRLAPAAKDASVAKEAIAELEQSAANAADASRRQDARRRAEAAARERQAEDERQSRLGRVNVDGQHYCYPEQRYENGRCVGKPLCPGMLMPDADTCVDAPCTGGRVRVDGGRCCFPGQTWSEAQFEAAYRRETGKEATPPYLKGWPIALRFYPSQEDLGCAGVPRCPAGTLAPDANKHPDLAHTCIPAVTRTRADGQDEPCEDSTNRSGVDTPYAWFLDLRLSDNPTLKRRERELNVEDLIEEQARAIGCSKYTFHRRMWCCP